MKITRISATEIIVPARENHVDRPAFGPALFARHPKWMLELELEDGTIGFGESPRAAPLANVRWAAEQIIGKNLFSLSWQTPVPRRLEGDDMYGHPNPPTVPRLHEVDWTRQGDIYLPQFMGDLGFIVAVQDLWAKALGVPLHALLGGKLRDTVAVSWWFGRSDAEHAARQMEIGLKQGFTSVKFKAAAEDDIVGIVRAIKTAGGDALPIVIDPNRRFYRVSEALRVAYSIEAWPNIIFEDPFPFIAGEWRLFRERSRIPLALTGIPGATEGACDSLVLEYPSWRFLGDAHMAWRLNMQCSHGSGVELGILDAYLVHVSSVARTCTLPGDAIGNRIREDDLIEEPLQLKEGAFIVPEGPGLGVTLDRRALEKYALQHWEIKI